MQLRPHRAHLIALALLAALTGWTWIVLSTDLLTPWDASSLSTGPTAESPAGQILAAVAIIASPVVVYTLIAGLAVWAWRRRLQRLAWAILASIPLTWGLTQLVKHVIARPRPPEVLPLITAGGWAYPSSHMSAITVAAIMGVAAIVVTRRRRAFLLAASALLMVVGAIVALNRWLLRAHWPTDLVGGMLLGATVAVTCLATAGVTVVRLSTPFGKAVRRERRAVVVYNPTKIPDIATFRSQVEGECAEHHWEAPIWIETDPDDAGASASRRARRRRPDLVLVAGGDGTVRTLCAEMAETGIPVAIVPAGTGNLLARNLNIPLDFAAALEVAFAGSQRPIDIIEVRADDGDEDYSLVMAGMGFDARIMSETNADLKKVVGPAAYVMAALQTLNTPPFDITLTLDGDTPVKRTPALALVANVGALQGQVTIAPDAQPDDGVLDLLVASPSSVLEWGAITTRILTHSEDHPGLERAQSKHIVIEASEPVAYQIDGDALGECRRIEATVLPQAVVLMVP
ncbi:MAG: diacylglycerol kinase family protein [Propioniciclava sp.]|uniref:diacylglycerol kinase family protein n=1 Tax=Propioniciclava sp. TaxID=2038686 RepID=UPI0039E45445